MPLDMRLLKQLCEIPGTSGDERQVRDFILNYIRKHQKNWASKPVVLAGDDFQNCILLKFGTPRTAIFAHMDTVGFTVRYSNQLLPVGSPEAESGTVLVGQDARGPIVCTLEIDPDRHASYRFNRTIERGTPLSYQVHFRRKGQFIESAYLDDRLGVYNALQVAAKMNHGVIALSCWEEHRGGSVPYLIKYMHEQWGIQQALVSDITWSTDGVHPGKGVVISVRDRNIPRRGFVQKVIDIAWRQRIKFQLEVEGTGSSDGGELQLSPYPVDWCFVGAPQEHPHTPHERVHKADIDQMEAIYHALMAEL